MVEFNGRLPTVSRPLRIAVLVSGEGTNLQAILDDVHGRDGVEVVAVASNRADAPALARAECADVTTAVFTDDEYMNRNDRDLALAEWLTQQQVELVVLAGYMQLLSAEFLARFPQQVINVHPSLLPAFSGVRAIEQAVEYGVKVFGVTVHYVDEGIDSGQIIAQRAIEPTDPTDLEAVRRELQQVEHELLPAVICQLARSRSDMLAR